MAKKSEVLRKLYYYRVNWADYGEEHGTMEQLLTEAHSTLSIAEKRVFDAKEGKKLTGTQFEYRENCLLLQISLYDPDQPTSTIAKHKKGKKAETAVTKAPEGSDFLETDVFALVKNNHVVLCSLGQSHLSLAKSYFRNILKKVNRQKEATYFDLERVANINKLKMIHNEGVQRIELNVSTYLESFNYMLKQNKNINPSLKQIITNCKESLLGLFSQDNKTNETRGAEYLNAKIIIGSDGERLRGKKMELAKFEAQQSLTELSDLILNDNNDGYTIFTKEGSVIRSDEILTAESFELKKLGNSLSCEDAWSKLLSYYHRLSSKGILVQ